VGSLIQSLIEVSDFPNIALYATAVDSGEIECTILCADDNPTSACVRRSVQVVVAHMLYGDIGLAAAGACACVADRGLETRLIRWQAIHHSELGGLRTLLSNTGNTSVLAEKGRSYSLNS
jgi:hypothetical protein